MSDATTRQSGDKITHKQTLLDAFRVFLDADDKADPAESALPKQPVDLYTLLSELAALKNEVKLEARQFKKALQELHSISEHLNSDQTVFLAELDRSHKTLSEQHSHEALRPVIMQLLDLYDRMHAGLSATGQYKPGLFTPRREVQVIHAQRQGQALTLKRLQQTLAECDVWPIKTLGLLLDPYQMRATEIESRQEIADGIVTKELRTGFVWGKEILRTAEVTVNKIPAKN